MVISRLPDPPWAIRALRLADRRAIDFSWWQKQIQDFSSCHSRRWRDHRINDFLLVWIVNVNSSSISNVFPPTRKNKKPAAHLRTSTKSLCRTWRRREELPVSNICISYHHEHGWKQKQTDKILINTLTRNFCLSENDLRENIKSIFPPICRLGAGSQASMAPNKSCMMDHLQTIESNRYIDQTALQ